LAGLLRSLVRQEKSGKGPELQRRVDENDKLHKEYKKIRARKETELLEHLRAEYFATLGDVCLENQYTTPVCQIPWTDVAAH